MKRSIKFYLKLFWSTFTLSAFTFGGGYVIAGLMKKKFVDKFGWIEDSEMLDILAIAQSSPGSIAVNVSILIGYKMAGILGSIITILATVMPPFLITTVISYFYIQFEDNEVVIRVLKGVSAGVAALITDVVISMFMSVLKNKKALPILISIACFVLVAILKINVIVVILICAGIGALTTINENGEKLL